ncbi:hypothetical protein UFOVP185_19 [uncultured Caudovirales phage]|uniref:Uncharacterized protein n=1 Tax=uncultured Caudovirales phage TaxID=2100421 RepID=A0A6J7WGS4_9CAUD|nr:hypothetical protein UFOVP185_19 [uncultured Caudovirales phage]
MGPKCQQEMINYELVHHNQLREMYNKRADDSISYESWFVARYSIVNNTFLTDDEILYLIELKSYITRNYLQLCTLHNAHINLGTDIKLFPYFIQHFNTLYNK